MLGYDVDFGHMEAVSLISAPKYPEKQVIFLLTCFYNDLLLYSSLFFFCEVSSQPVYMFPKQRKFVGGKEEILILLNILQVGYIVTSSLLNENHDFLRLAINTVRNDIIGRNETFQCLALTMVWELNAYSLVQIKCHLIILSVLSILN